MLQQIIVVTLLCVPVLHALDAARSQQIIDYVNNKPDGTWRAGINRRFEAVPLHVLKGMMGVKETTASILPMKQRTEMDRNELPDAFDPRTKWTFCPSLNEIRDQAACGSCWAFGAVESITDRICIFSKGKKKPHISAEDLLSCCTACGDGCEGGMPGSAWQYWVDEGIVTGSNFTDDSGCRPYEIPPCEHHVNGTLKPCGKIVPTPECKKYCRDGYPRTYQQDKQFGSKAYNVPSDEEEIKKELFQSGPVEASFTVYEDFTYYRKGVYQHETGSELGGHAVRLLGWGTENGTPYWLLANSWNRDWGDNGYFKIIRGQDKCGIESSIVAGTPKLNQSKNELNAKKKHNHHYNTDVL